MAKLKDVRFKKTNLSSTGEIEFDQDMLAVLMAVDENKSLLQVAKESKMNLTDFKACLLKLYKLKLVEKVEVRIEYVESVFLEIILETLVRILGPMGEILMQDAAENLHLEMPNIPVSYLTQFIGAIANEIPGDAEKTQFQNIIREKRGDFRN